MRPHSPASRTPAHLIFAAIAWLGAACDRTDMPTEAGPMALVADPPCFVPTPAYPTIQAAVNDPFCNPINVAPGTYAEPDPGPLTIFRTVTLLGAQSGVDARSRVGLESIINDMQGTSVSASNVVIDGFTVQNSTNPFVNGGFGILLIPTVSGTQIVNNIIQDNIIGIGLANSGASQAVIRHNLIRNNTKPGAASGSGIYTDQFVGGPTVTDVLIEENAFIGHAGFGGAINISNTAPAGGVFNLEVASNAFDMNSRAFVLFNTHMSTIHDNTITNSTFVGSADIRIFDNNTNLSILNNDLSNGVGHAIRLSFGSGAPFMPPTPSSNVEIHQNNIEVYGLTGLTVNASSHVGTVNAECNWWNSSTGPTNPNNTGGTGEEVAGDADFTPWLIAPAPGGPCAGGVPPRVSGGGQINVTGGRGSFGFSANAITERGHLDYMNHASRVHLNCTVDVVMILSATKAHLEGTCSSNTYTGDFAADVEDNADPGKNADKFQITYSTIDGAAQTIRSGNIQIH